MYIVGGFGKKGYTFDTQNEVDQLVRKVATDVAFTLRQVSASRVIFALDSKSWRKDIEIEENEGYKGHRKKSTNLNWKNIYQSMDDFCDVMSKKGLISTKIETAEADDIMCLWRDELLYKHHEHVVLVSGDEDIRQLVSANMDDDRTLKFATIFNPFTQGKNATKKLFGNEMFEKWLQTIDGEGDIFNRNAEPDKESFISLIKEHNVKLEIIDGEEIALKKIFCGDDGDNVPAIYTWMGKTQKGDPKEFRITPVKYKKIIEELLPLVMSKNIDYMDLSELAEPIEKFLVKESQHVLPFKMIDRINRQIRLVVLAKIIFPGAICKAFDLQAPDELAKKPDQINGWYMNTMLEGTRYVNEHYQRSKNEASIFKEIDNISQSLF
jgi:5'-3' exonuclease